jgi:glycosyltransferase involved in cell wall biosynthesis
MIDQCLRRLTEQDYPRDSLEILVIDGGSTDDTVARAQEYAGVRVIRNPAGNAERAKEIGLREARGDLFMYLDADAELCHPLWLQTMALPLRDDATVVASYTRFVARARARPIDRYLNYHPLQLGPLLDELCVDIEDTKVAARPGYSLCCFSAGRVPPVGLCLYRLDVLRRVAHEKPAFQWIDVGVPEMLTKAGYAHFAYVPSAGIHHGRPASLGTLIAKQRRNVAQVYFPSVDTRDFRYVEFSSSRAVLRLLWWVVKVNLILPLFAQAVRDSWRRRDVACLYRLPHAVLETNAVAIEFLRSAKGRALLMNGVLGWFRRVSASGTLTR